MTLSHQTFCFQNHLMFPNHRATQRQAEDPTGKTSRSWAAYCSPMFQKAPRRRRCQSFACAVAEGGHGRVMYVGYAEWARETLDSYVNKESCSIALTSAWRCCGFSREPRRGKGQRAEVRENNRAGVTDRENERTSRPRATCVYGRLLRPSSTYRNWKPHIITTSNSEPPKPGDSYPPLLFNTSQAANFRKHEATFVRLIDNIRGTLQYSLHPKELRLGMNTFVGIHRHPHSELLHNRARNSTFV